jgi:hypothetical protein
VSGDQAAQVTNEIDLQIKRFRQGRLDFPRPSTQVRIGSIPDPHPFAPDCKKCGHDHRAEEKADQSERC